MTQVNISQFRENLPSFMDRVFAGEEFLVMKNKIPMASVTPVKKEKVVLKRKIYAKAFGMWKNRWPISKSSTDIVNEWRKQDETRSYDR